LRKLTASHFPFQAQREGISLLLAGCVLFIMVLPMIVALSRDAIAIVPHDQFEGALSVGATKMAGAAERSCCLPHGPASWAQSRWRPRGRSGDGAVALVIGLNPLFPQSVFSHCLHPRLDHRRASSRTPHRCRCRAGVARGDLDVHDSHT